MVNTVRGIGQRLPAVPTCKIGSVFGWRNHAEFKQCKIKAVGNCKQPRSGDRIHGVAVKRRTIRTFIIEHKHRGLGKLCFADAVGSGQNIRFLIFCGIVDQHPGADFGYRSFRGHNPANGILLVCMALSIRAIDVNIAIARRYSHRAALPAFQNSYKIMADL